MVLGYPQGILQLTTWWCLTAQAMRCGKANAIVRAVTNQALVDSGSSCGAFSHLRTLVGSSGLNS